jgi:hypothetical protein
MPGALAALLLVGCPSTPPGLSDGEVQVLAHVEGARSTLYYRDGELELTQVEELLPLVEGVRSEVEAELGAVAPRTELILYQRSGLGGGSLIHHTECIFENDRIRFRYPYDEEDPLSQGQLLGTVAHEVAEATLLSQVTVIDPYLRWAHDGVAELVEHQVLCVRDVEVARTLLRRVIRFVSERRADGVQTLDLTRWRQIAPWVVRSHRFLDSDGNLSLEDVDGSLERVRAARAEARPDDVRGPGLAELEQLLLDASARRDQAWSPNEARPDDAERGDLLYYNVAFALWLEVERNAPGTMRRFVGNLAERRAGDDHVLTASEAWEALEASCAGSPLPDLTQIELADVESVLRAEERRLAR